MLFLFILFGKDAPNSIKVVIDDKLWAVVLN